MNKSTGENDIEDIEKDQFSHAYVDMEDYRFSYSEVETDALSTCLGLLLDGSTENQEFCALSHSSKIYERNKNDDPKDLLIDLMQKLKSFMIEHLKIASIKRLKLLVVGGIVGENVVTRKAFSLLNADINLNEFKKLTKDTDEIYLLTILKNSVQIIKPITFAMTDDEELKGKQNRNFFLLLFILTSRFNCF